jgi:LacI family transcriptional regulator, repressor for deo operon, udp, cdd, tsx, nupC, and nupG
LYSEPVSESAIPNRARPTIYDVARLAGVSPSTVSRMLNGKGQFTPATRTAVEQAVRQLRYRPNTIARSLRTKSTQTIAFLLPYVPDPFFVSLIGGIQQHALKHDYSILLCVTEGDPEREEHYLHLLQAKQVDGALIDGPVLPATRIARFVEDGFPIVCVDRDVDLSSVPLVQVDNRLGARLATEHLIALGHRRIAHVSGSELQRFRHSRERLAGYREALAGAGVGADPRLVAAGDYTEEGGRRATRAVLDAGVEFSAVFAANDLSAIGAMSALAGQGRRVPDDVSVVGFDDVHISAFINPPLTTVHQPAAEIAQRATELLIALIHGREVAERRHVLEPRLVVRASTAAPR